MGKIGEKGATRESDVFNGFEGFLCCFGLFGKRRRRRRRRRHGGGSLIFLVPPGGNLRGDCFKQAQGSAPGGGGT